MKWIPRVKWSLFLECFVCQAYFFWWVGWGRVTGLQVVTEWSLIDRPCYLDRGIFLSFYQGQLVQPYNCIILESKRESCYGWMSIVFYWNMRSWHFSCTFFSELILLTYKLYLLCMVKFFESSKYSLGFTSLFFSLYLRVT